MEQEACPRRSVVATHKFELGTAAVILALGVGLGFALPEDQSMPHPYNRIITVGHLYFMCTDAAANAIQFAMMTKCFATCCGTARKFAY